MPDLPPLAKGAQQSYRRDLPHIQFERRTFFVTFNTYKRWILPEPVRQRVLEHCLHDEGNRYFLHGAVVMPDHVHVVLTPARDSSGATFGMAEIMSGIKGASAHSVNRMLGRKGHVWQSESFDRMLRSDENARQVAEYVCQNPVRAGLVAGEDEYPWLWRRWVEGANLDTEH